MTENQLFECRRKEQIEALTQKLDALLPGILARHIFNEEKPMDLKSQQLSLNAKIGSKFNTYMNVTDTVITSADEFAALWFRGMIRYIQTEDRGREAARAAYQFQQMLAGDPQLLLYAQLFLKRTFLRNYYSLSKLRPPKEEAELWIGQNNADYGLLITPRFQNGEWENDVSEIRHFRRAYWTIGHVLDTGLVVPHRDQRITFSTVEDYLCFFQNAVVRLTGSPYQEDIAQRYCDFVRASKNPFLVPLLIPELRYGGLAVHHQYRLDFTIIDPYSLQKQGFELSPWSTHGHLDGAGSKSSKELNAEARKNFEREMQKLKDYFRKFGIYTIVYTDSDLTDCEKIFEEMKQYLCPRRENKQLLDAAIQQFLEFRIPTSPT